MSTAKMVRVGDDWLTFRQAVFHFKVVSYQLAHRRVKRDGWEPLAAATTPKGKPGRQVKEKTNEQQNEQ